MPPRIAVVGSVNLDFVARCERLPRPGETVGGASFERVPGGKGANQAVACARLGADVRFVGMVAVDDMAEEALAGLERPLSRYLLELEPEVAEGRSWYGGPSAAELLEWDAVLRRAGVRVSSTRVAQAYLELAVLVRALEGLADSARMGSLPDSGSLWAGLFDLRENLLSQAVDDLRALAA